MPNIGLALPITAPDARTETVVELARTAEEAGAHSVWTIDRLVFESQESLVSLAAVAAVTTRVRLGTSVLLPTLRPPLLLAKMIASVDQLSGGRVILGIGVGSREDDFAASGVPFEQRGSRAAEMVRLLKLAWSGEPVRHAGRFYQMDVGPVGPRPVQQPHPPIWFGGNAEPALRRAGRIADGYIGVSGGGPEGFRAAWGKVCAAARAAGRDPAAIRPALLAFACVDDDRKRAEALALRYLANYYGPRRTDTQPFLLGPAEECVAKARAYFAAGVETLIIASVTADPRYFDRLCEQVVPRLASLPADSEA